ncbi:LysM peptidoglycan-binding domain-containing protein [Pontibacter liquoris]|uniref:LysM peptidoglycan-binding domain-containing protein n=1 Tax=Pontibacter liquoris TaxID=2905677 RepID=UPI001FA73CC9|nr:LysM peptidoglycan-binding domain-containing protein [Pontibacter liquoris]
MGLLDFFKKGKEEPVKTGNPNISPQKGTATSGQMPGQTAQSMPSTADTSAHNDVYTVQSGDSLSKIAKKLYGDANSWHKLYDANKQTIGDNPDLIRPGQRLDVPRK